MSEAFLLDRPRAGPIADPDFRSVRVGGLPIAVLDRAQSAQWMIEAAHARRGQDCPPLVVSSANGQVISLCARDAGLREIFLSCDLLHADGMPLVFASRLKCESGLPERVATTDLFGDVAERAQEHGTRFYMLGGTPETLNEAVARVKRAYPMLVVAGARDGFFSREDEAQVVADINAAKPDILWIGMGVPREQDFALRNRERLTNVGLIKTSGGLFDFLAGKNPRAPEWMQAAGLEWLYRLAQEPRRLFVRYLVTNPHALYLLLTQSSDDPDPHAARAPLRR